MADADDGDFDVAVVVVTHAGIGSMLTRCVDSVVGAGGVDRLLVVDNSAHASVDDETPPGVDRLIRSPNRGFGAAANLAFADPSLASTRYLALLNDDVVVEPGWLVPLRHTLDGDDMIGAVQPKLLLAGVDPPTVNSLGVELDRFAAGHDIAFGRADTDANRPAGGCVSTIDIFTGGAVLFRRRFIDDFGGFDERYFLYYEDVDLALRGARRGWTYRCDQRSVVHHEFGSTTARDGDRTILLRERNRLWAAFRFQSPATVARAVWLSVRRVRHAPRAVHARALSAGIAGAPRMLRERAGQARR